MVLILENCFQDTCRQITKLFKIIATSLTLPKAERCFRSLKKKLFEERKILLSQINKYDN